MENTRQKHRKWPWILALVLLAAGALAFTLYTTLPIHDDFMKSVGSVSSLRSQLRSSEAVSDVVLFDGADFGLEPERITVPLDGRVYDSKPVGYFISFRPAGDEASVTGVKAGPVDSWYYLGVTLEEEYRGAGSKLEFSDDTVDKTMRDGSLFLGVGRYLYQICGSFDKTGLSPEEITAREEQIKTQLYRAADWILDQ